MQLLLKRIIQWFPNDTLKQSWKSGFIFQILESKLLGTGKKFNVTPSSIVNFVDEENKIVSSLAVLGSWSLLLGVNMLEGKKKVSLRTGGSTSITNCTTGS